MSQMELGGSEFVVVVVSSGSNLPYRVRVMRSSFCSPLGTPTPHHLWPPAPIGLN